MQAGLSYTRVMVGGAIGVLRILPEPVRFAGRLVLATVLLSLVAYFAVRAQPNQGFVPIWPSGGLGLALLWRYGAKYWPAVFLSSTVLSTTVGTPLLAATGVGWLQVLIVGITLLLLRRWEVKPSLDDLRQFGLFVLASAIASAVALPVYGVRVGLVLHYPPALAFEFGMDYFLSALFSSLIFTPLLVASLRPLYADRLRRMVLAASLAGIAIAGVVIPNLPAALQDRCLFLLLPFMITAAITGRVAGASAAAALLTLVLIAMARQTAVTITDNLLRSTFIVVAALTGYLLAVVFNEREHAAAEMDHRARHDTLTGLMNRYEFENRLAEALQDRMRRYALLYLDLDQFKLVNDSCGHLAGDHMLREIAGTIERAAPAGAVLARLGGDEFGCLLHDASLEEAAEAARRLHDAIRAFHFLVGELSFTVGVSIGATFLTPGDGEATDDVLSRADIACYTAKEHGRNRTHIYSPSDASMHRRHSEIQELSQLKSALASGLFTLNAQRIARLDGRQPEAPFYEVLLKHADAAAHGAIEELLGMARRYGLIGEVDRWVCAEAGRMLARTGTEGLRLSVNVSAATLESEGFQAYVMALPAQHGFTADRMVLEITEAVAVQNLTRAVESLKALRAQGFGIALDDFGAGVASFGYLRELPVTMVKLDGRFVRDLLVDPSAEVVIGALAKLAALREIICIAEWVEDAAVLPRLAALGVDYAQGYAIHRPEPLENLAPKQG